MCPIRQLAHPQTRAAMLGAVLTLCLGAPTPPQQQAAAAAPVAAPAAAQAPAPDPAVQAPAPTAVPYSAVQPAPAALQPGALDGTVPVSVDADHQPCGGARREGGDTIVDALARRIVVGGRRADQSAIMTFVDADGSLGSAAVLRPRRLLESTAHRSECNVDMCANAGCDVTTPPVLGPSLALVARKSGPARRRTTGAIVTTRGFAGPSPCAL